MREIQTIDFGKWLCARGMPADQRPLRTRGQVMWERTLLALEAATGQQATHHCGGGFVDRPSA
jgi:hypothetical protein